MRKNKILWDNQAVKPRWIRKKGNAEFYQCLSCGKKQLVPFNQRNRVGRIRCNACGGRSEPLSITPKLVKEQFMSYLNDMDVRL